MAPTPDESVVDVPGPWTARRIHANGARFHAVEAGSGPLVLLLHGFPQFWWTWRHQLVTLADAGYHAVAPDLRGYGASDKPPRGYDLPTLAADVAGMVRALGERDAVVVGHGWGGLLAWTAATVHPAVVRRAVVVGVPHPRRLRAAVVTDSAQRRASRSAGLFQTPRYAEYRLVADEAAYVGELLHRWAGPDWPDAETAWRYRQAMRVPAVAHSALEYYRWAVRSLVRPDGVRYARAMRSPVGVPVLQVHGTLDRRVLPGTAAGSGRYVAAAYEWRLLDGVGHFPHEEAPERFDPELLRFLADRTKS